MSILIKGVEMPTGNNELRLIIHSNGQVIISHQTYYEEAEAVHVPPHGRLKDVDALDYTMLYKENWIRGTGDEAPAAWKSDIDAAPTIIPASGGKEDE